MDKIHVVIVAGESGSRTYTNDLNGTRDSASGGLIQLYLYFS